MESGTLAIKSHKFAPFGGGSGGGKVGHLLAKNRNLLYCVPPGGRAFAGCDSCDYLLPQIFLEVGRVRVYFDSCISSSTFY